MRNPTRRLALTGAAVTILAAAGIGLAAASTAPAPAIDPASAGGQLAALAAEPDEAFAADGPRLRRLARFLVHAELTLDLPDHGLLTVALDRGTIRAVGANSLTIAQADGATRVVRIDAETRVRIGRQVGESDDLAVGDEVIVRSRVEGGATTARLIIEIPAGSD